MALDARSAWDQGLCLSQNPFPLPRNLYPKYTRPSEAVGAAEADGYCDSGHWAMVKTCGTVPTSSFAAKMKKMQAGARGMVAGSGSGATRKQGRILSPYATSSVAKEEWQASARENYSKRNSEMYAYQYPWPAGEDEEAVTARRAKCLVPHNYTTAVSCTRDHEQAARDLALAL